MSSKSLPNPQRLALGLALFAMLQAGAGVAAITVQPTEQDATAQAALEQAPEVVPMETIDQYARRLLEQRLSAPTASEAHERPANAGQIGPAQFELIYITGTGARSRALIRLNKQYAKLAGSGDSLAGWVLSDIGPDYVDIYKDEEQARIYLFSSTPPMTGN